MDFAIESGRLAAETVLAAKEKDDYSAASLATYTAKLDDSFIMKDLKHYAKFPAFMEETRRMFTDYGPMLNEIMGGLFTVDGSVPVPLTKKAMGAVKKVGLMNIAKDARKGMKAL